MGLRRGSGHKRERLTPTERILAAGGVAAALGSIVALGTQVGSWFRGDPAGEVAQLVVRATVPMTYGQWRSREGVANEGVPKDQLRIRGQMIAFDVDTAHYREDDRLPVRIIVHDLARGSSREVETDPIRVQAGDDCGCADWVAAPPGRATYRIEVAVLPPGPRRGEPLKSAVTDELRSPST